MYVGFLAAIAYIWCISLKHQSFFAQVVKTKVVCKSKASVNCMLLPVARRATFQNSASTLFLWLSNVIESE